jgi:hypothetical protein
LKIFFYTSGMTRDLIDIYAPGELWKRKHEKDISSW